MKSCMLWASKNLYILLSKRTPLMNSLSFTSSQNSFCLSPKLASMINTTQNSQSVLHITRGWTSDSFTIMTDFPWNNYCDSDIYYSPACPNKNGIGRLPALAVCTVVKFWYIFHNLARVNCWYFYKTIIINICITSIWLKGKLAPVYKQNWFSCCFMYVMETIVQWDTISYNLMWLSTGCGLMWLWNFFGVTVIQHVNCIHVDAKQDEQGCHDNHSVFVIQRTEGVHANFINFGTSMRCLNTHCNVRHCFATKVLRIAQTSTIAWTTI